MKYVFINLKNFAVKNMCFDLLRSGKYVLSRQTVELTAVQDISQADNLEVRDEVRQSRT